MQSPTDAIALLIDADNMTSLSDTGIALILSKLECLGTVAARQAYGNWGSPQLKEWSKLLRKYAIAPVQQFNYSSGKNATDIALTIGAMDLAHSGKFQKFCIVSCDSDFTPLAMRLRSQGFEVYGFGVANKTAASFREACTSFVALKLNKAHPSPAPDSSPKAVDQPSISDKNNPTGQAKKQNQTAAAASAKNGATSQNASTVEPIFVEAVSKTLNSSGWAESVNVGQYLAQHKKNKTSYNISSWTKYYKKFSQIFEVKQSKGHSLIRVLSKP